MKGLKFFINYDKFKKNQLVVIKMIRRNLLLFKLDNFLGGLWPLSALSIVYFEQITASYALAMAVFSLSSLVTTFMEIPVGIFSDKVGRRKTLICSPILVFLTFLFWALAGQFSCIEFLFLGAFFWGTSAAIASGTADALVYETMEELKKQGDFNVQYAKNGGWNQVGLALSAISAGVVTYFFSLQVLAWVSLFPSLIHIIVVYFFVEPKRNRVDQRVTSFKHFLISFRRLKRNKRLRFSDWLINMARFLKQICGIIGFFVVPYIRKIGMIKLFFFSMFGNVFVRVLGVVLSTVLTPFIMSMVNLFYGIGRTANADIMQKEFSPHQRATMQSIISFLSGILLAIVMVVFGFIGDVFGPTIAIILAISVKALTMIISLCLIKKVYK